MHSLLGCIVIILCFCFQWFLHFCTPNQSILASGRIPYAVSRDSTFITSQEWNYGILSFLHKLPTFQIESNKNANFVISVEKKKEIVLSSDTPTNSNVDVDYTKELMEEEEVSGSVEMSSETESVSEEEKSEEISESVEMKDGEKNKEVNEEEMNEEENKEEENKEVNEEEVNEEEKNEEEKSEEVDEEEPSNNNEEVNEKEPSNNNEETNENASNNEDTNDDSSNNNEEEETNEESLENTPVISSKSTKSTSHWFSRKIRKNKNKPTDAPFRSLIIPSLSNEAIQQQQARLDSFLLQTKENQEKYLSIGRQVIYKIHRESGLGNMIRGYITALVIGLFTNRSVQIKSPRDFYYRFFIPPFPHMTASFTIASHVGNLSYWEYTPGRLTTKKLREVPLEDWWNSPAVVVLTYSDLASRYLEPSLYQARLEKMGILPVLKSSISPGVMGSYFKAVLLPLIMNPQPYLCTIINKHISILSQKKMIGIQMRLGGQKANYKEKLFLGPNSVRLFIEKVRKVMEMKGWKEEDVNVFVSTDSNFALREVKKALNTPNHTIVYSTNEFSIGHSALGKTSAYGEKTRDGFINRAIIDLLILKESDYLIYSQGSSYGQMAYELQQAYRYPVTVKNYLEKQNLSCSVFHPKKQFGEGTYISKYFGKKKKK